MTSTLSDNQHPNATQNINPGPSGLRPEKWRIQWVWVRRFLFVAIVSYLTYRLTEIGWGELVGALPKSPLFYILSLAIFLVLPVSEIINYQLITGQRIPNGLRIFARKRVYNEAVIAYAGEAYLCREFAKLPGFDTRDALIAVKDNNLISAFISNTWTIILVLLLIFLGRPEVLKTLFSQSPVLVGGFAFICLFLYILVLIFARRLSKLSSGIMARVAAVHGGKVLVTAGLQVAQWAVAIPAATSATWLMFLAAQTLLKRIPGLPNTELIFLGVGLSLVGFVDADSARISAMLVAATAMAYIVHLAVFILTTRAGRQKDMTDIGQV